MHITITCESFKELRELTSRLVFLEDCTTSKKGAKKMSAKDRSLAAGEKNKRKKVSSDDIRRLLESGLTPKQIAEKLGCHISTVYNNKVKG